MSRAVIVVPCFNEARRLNMRQIQDFGRRAAGVELLFVNDGSSDETQKLLDHLHQSNPRAFRCLDLAINCGKAEAVRRGILAALADGPDAVGFWDADLATPLAEIDNFCRVLDSRPDVEIVIGTRLPLLGHRIVRQPVRRWLGRAFARAASSALGTRMVDTQCGAKLFRVTPRLASLFDRAFLTRWIFDVELFARLEQQLRPANRSLADVVYEYPLDSWRDVAGSSLKRGDFFKAVLELARIYSGYLSPWAGPAPHAAVPAPHLPVHPPVTPQRSDQRAA